MRYLVLIATLIAVPMATSGCTSGLAPVEPPRGVLYTSFKAPLTTDFHETPVCTKQGESSTYYIRFPVPNPSGGLMWVDLAWAKAGLEQAARKGGLTNVEYADYKFTSILGLVEWFTVTAYGN